MHHGGRGGPPGGYPPAGKYSAARSHVMNDKYMDDFEKAWEEMHGLSVGGGGGRGRGGPPSGSALAAQQRSLYAALEEPSDAFAGPPSGYARGAAPGAARGAAAGASRASPSHAAPGRAAAATGPGPRAGAAAGGGGAPAAARGAGAGGGGLEDAFPSRRPAARGPGAGGAVGGAARYPPRAAAGWRTGPLDQAGALVDLSDRPNTCSAAHWARGEVVVGSTDHALYVLDAAKGALKRTLYNKACGHTEWVSCVTYCPDGKVVSGGMDSKLWLWPAGGVRGTQLEGHFGPLSQVKYDPSSGLVISASYDKTLRLWDVGGRGSEVGCLQGHDAPVLEAEVGPGGRIVSGDRSGHILLWDTSTSAASWRMKGVHAGHVTALVWFDPTGPGGGEDPGTHAECFVSGGQDGVVRVWDTRARSNVAKVQLHVNEQGRGAVGNLVAGGGAAGGALLSTGADGTFRVLDPRMGFALSATAQLTDFPYSMTAAGGTAAVGCGDGSVHFIDVQSGTTLYALGANRAAVRCMEASHDTLMCSGDDGNAVFYTFAG